MDDKSRLSYTVKRFEHKSPNIDKSLRTSHYVQEVTSFEPPMPCLLHYNDNVSHICIDCQYKVLCGTCLQEGVHRSHNIKNIEKGSKIIDRILNETLIRLRSKSDLLTHLNDCMSIRKTQLYTQYKDYMQLVDNNFEILMRDLVQKKEQLIENIQSYYEAQSQKITQVIRNISQETRNSIKMIEFITENIQKLEPVSLCLFYWQKKILIEGAIDQVNSKMDGYKKEVPDIKWTLEYEPFDKLREQIQSLNTTYNKNEIFFQFNVENGQSKKKVRNKSLKVEKGLNNFSSTLTPKCVQSFKDLKKCFKSPRNLKKKNASSRKLLSMPASPSKEKATPITKSPSRVKIEHKFKKQKKEPK